MSTLPMPVVAAYANRRRPHSRNWSALTAAGSLQRRVEHLRAAERAASEAHRRWLDARKGLLRVALQQRLERVNLQLALGGEY